MASDIDGWVRDPDSCLPVSALLFFFNIIFFFLILSFNMSMRPTRMKTAFLSLPGTQMTCDFALTNKRSAGVWCSASRKRF